MKIIFFKQTLEDFQYFLNHKSILNLNTFSLWFFKDPVCSATTRCVLGCNQIQDLLSWKLDEWGTVIFTKHKAVSRCDCKHHLCLCAHRNVWAEMPAVLLLQGEGRHRESTGACAAPRLPSVHPQMSLTSAVTPLLRGTRVSKSDHAAYGIPRLPCVCPTYYIFWYSLGDEPN